MSAARRFVARLLAVVVASSALTVGLAIDPPFANAAVRHRTLNDTRPVGSAPVTPGHAIGYFGLVADVDSPRDGLDPRGATPYGEARFLVDGHWTPWQRLDQDGAQAAGQFTGSLIAVDHASAYQVRNLPKGAHNWRAAAINTTDGPVEVLAKRGPTEARAAVNCRSRADWGADESITKWSKGTDTQVFAPVQVVTVHHTAGSNNLSQDYSATMRAILSYHVGTNGWSDIAYQYLIDSKGILYEGRNAGHTSKSCLTGSGDGSDFAHRSADDQLVTGGHVGSMNGGNLGIALVGCYENGECSGDTTVPAASVGSLTTRLTELAQRHSLNPQGTVNYDNPTTTAYKNGVASISAHLDWSATACPGGNLYAQLPAIRADVAQRLAAPPVSGTPAAPTSLTAAAISTSHIALTWTDNATNETGYRVERSTDGFNTTTTTGLGANVTSYPDTSVTPGTTYLYRVIAVNGTGDSAPSNTASATTLPQPPATPSGLTAIATSSTRIDLAWTDNATNETGYRVDRAAAEQGPWALIATPGAGSTSYSDTNLTPEIRFWYRVTAFNTGGPSDPSATASATTLAAPTLPAAPAGLTAKAMTKNVINLAWTDSSDNETGFLIERCKGSTCTSFTQVASVGSTMKTYVNSGLAGGTTYRYRIRAYNAAGKSAYSNIASATTPRR